jgi:hypothetical protein
MESAERAVKSPSRFGIREKAGPETLLFVQVQSPVAVSDADCKAGKLCGNHRRQATRWAVVPAADFGWWRFV